MTEYYTKDEYAALTGFDAEHINTLIRNGDISCVDVNISQKMIAVEQSNINKNTLKAIEANSVLTKNIMRHFGISQEA